MGYIRASRVVAYAEGQEGVYKKTILFRRALVA
jgi:hypothetical protein